MIDAFKSTLEELLYTHAVIVVIDASDHFDNFEKKFKTCMKTLDGLGVERGKMIFALNKLDLISYDDLEEKIEVLEELGTRRIMTVSAKTGENIEELKDLIKRTIIQQ